MELIPNYQFNPNGTQLLIITTILLLITLYLLYKELRKKERRKKEQELNAKLNQAMREINKEKEIKIIKHINKQV